MTLRLSLRSTRRSLARPVENARRRWHERAATIITLESDAARGCGEASPLPGFSRDSLADCETALAALDPRSLPERRAPGASVPAQLARASSAISASVPAARAALECALLELWANAEDVPAWALLSSEAEPAPRRVCALISEQPEQWLERALAARARGLGACKVKVGRDAARELAALATLRSELGPSFTLRLDANRAWSSAEARAHLPRFAAYAPELIEEPCAALSEILPSPIPLALDESLLDLPSDITPATTLSASGVSALVLKPALLGGISACFAWAARAHEQALGVILSHTFDGPLGLALSAALALTLGSIERAQGIDLDGAGEHHGALPYFARGELRAWREPGFGELGASP